MANKRRESSYREVDGIMVNGVCCVKCTQWKPLSEYSPDNRMALGIRSKCGECLRKEYDSKRQTVRLDQLSDALRLAVELELGIKTKEAE